jgi:two-component system, sensor histidine kinase
MALPTLSPGVDLLVIIDTADQDWVLGDGSRIQQILTNLVCNAVKVTKEGTVTIVVDWTNNHVRLECRDTGPGISKEAQLQMFDRFVEDERAPGSGLGLAMAKQMAMAMGGSICCESDPDRKPGTSCTVLLPLMPCKPAQPEMPPRDDSCIEDALAILLVDDIPITRSMLKRRLMRWIAPNCTVTEAVNGEQALLLCEQKPFDVIVMDQYMEESGGVMLGTDVIAALRELNRSAALIIGCSGNDLDAKFLAAGADFVWKKPIPTNAEIIHQFRHATRRQGGVCQYRAPV